MIICNGSPSMARAASTIAKRVLEAMGHKIACESDVPPMAFSCHVCGQDWEVTSRTDCGFGEGRPVFVLDDDRECEIAGCGIECERRDDQLQENGYQIARRPPVPIGGLAIRAYTAPKHIRRGRAGSPWSSADVISMAPNTIHHRDDWTAMKLADGGILVADSHASPCTILDAARKLWPRDVFRFELDAHAQELLDAAAALRGAS